jgi:hypothetical protein
MTTGPGDQREAAGRGHLRASHADREQVIGVLKAAFVQGMLTKDELDLRAGQALASRTYADLAALTADLPAGAASAQPPQPARGQDKARALRPGRVLAVATAVYAGAWPVAFILPGDSENGSTLLLLASLAYLLVLLISVGEMVVSRIDQRSGGQLPQGPASSAGTQASRRLPAADRGRQLPPVDHGHRHTADAAPIVRPRLLPSSLAEEPVMAEPPDQTPAAAGRGHQRASHADREQVIGVLKAAFVQGMLARDEFDLRVGQALASGACADLAALTADLPAGLAAAQPPQPVRARDVAPVRRPGLVLAVATVLYVTVWPVGAFLVLKNNDSESLRGFGLVALATLLYVVVLATSGMDLLFSWQDQRATRQLPGGPAPGAGGQASPRPTPADRGGLPRAGPGGRHAAEAAPIVRPGLLPS